MHIVLDLDGTLISDTIRPAYTRPFLDLFFRFIFMTFETVSIWTAASEEWYQEAYETLLKPLLNGKKFYKVYTSKNCTYKMLHSEYGCYSFSTTVKHLKKFWRRNKDFTRYNTLIVDNTSTTYKFNYGNAIHIKTFEYDKNDIELLKLIKWLCKNIIGCDNVRTLSGRVL